MRRTLTALFIGGSRYFFGAAQPAPFSLARRCSVFSPINHKFRNPHHGMKLHALHYRCMESFSLSVYTLRCELHLKILRRRRVWGKAHRRKKDATSALCAPKRRRGGNFEISFRLACNRIETKGTALYQLVLSSYGAGIRTECQ